MNMYEGRSMVSNDVKKWSNECDAAIELWDRQAVDLMSEVLHLMLIPSDALAVECDARYAASGRETARCTLAVILMPDCCTRPWNGQMHADDCLLSELHLMPMSLNAVAIVNAKWLHPMLMHQMHWRSCLIVRTAAFNREQSDARWRLFVTKIRCNQLIATSFAMKLKKQKSVADATSFVMMSEIAFDFKRSNALMKLFDDVKKTAFDFERSNALTIYLNVSLTENSCENSFINLIKKKTKKKKIKFV